MATFKIKLIDVGFFSKIGVFEEERIDGNKFILNLEVAIDACNFKKEELETTISYAEIYEIVKEIMGEERLLLETVAVEIKERLTERWPDIRGGRIEIIKTRPPIEGIDGSCGIEYLF